MKKMFALLLALLMLLSLAACGSGEEAEETEAEELTRSGMPEDADPAPEDEVEEPEYLDWDLSICQPEEAYRELEHYNIDPTGYRGLRLRVAGEFFVVQDHGKTFYYVGVRDEDGCVENLELRFPGDGSLPEGFPEEGETVTVWGVLDYYGTERDGKTVNSRKGAISPLRKGKCVIIYARMRPRSMLWGKPPRRCPFRPELRRRV